MSVLMKARELSRPVGAAAGRLARGTGASFARVRASRAGRAAGAAVMRARSTRLGRAADAKVAHFRDYVAARVKGHMTAAERVLMAGVFSGGPDPSCVVQTSSRTDVGQWWNEWIGGGRVWIAVAGDDITLLAQGKRPHVERLPIAGLGASQYNPVTGELVLAKAANETVRKLRLPPVEGWQVLGYIVKRGE